jgi:hypothetical protein
LDRTSDPKGVKYRMYFINLIEKNGQSGLFAADQPIFGKPVAMKSEFAGGNLTYTVLVFSIILLSTIY